MKRKQNMKITKKSVSFMMAIIMFLSIWGISDRGCLIVEAAKKVNVKQVVSVNSLTGSKTIKLAKGKKAALKTTVRVTPNRASNKKVTYKSSNKKIATVTSKGIVTGKKAGTASITVTSKKNKKKIAVVTVKVVKGKVTNITFGQTSGVLRAGRTAKLKAAVTTSAGGSRDVVWTTSNKKVATVDKNGKVKAVKPGTATITVKAADGTEKKAVYKLTVKKKQLTGPEALITCGNYYNSVLEKAVKNGEAWVYSNSNKYVLQGGTFEQMLAEAENGKMRGGNCASIANWAFRDMGVMSVDHKFYGDSKGQIRNYHTGTKKVKEEFDKNCTIIEGDGESFETLVDEGTVQVGDVIIGKGHTFIYRGDGTVFASGHDAIWHTDESIETDDPQQAVFERWIREYRGTYDGRFKPSYIIRLKDSFIPAYYRNSKGKLVRNW